MKIKFNHYRFNQYTRQVWFGVSVSKEEFATKTIYDFSFQYGKGSAYVTFTKDKK